MQNELMTIAEVCRFFGGTKPLNPVTIYRNLGTRFPLPITVGKHKKRWLRSECEQAIRDMAAERTGRVTQAA
jgi:predicted DNA-binding transcriptional regulator AlpA